MAAATSNLEAVRAEEAAARLELSAAVAETYAELSRLYAERAAVEDALRIRSETAALVGQRLGNGLENAGRLHQAEAGVSAARADLAAVDGDIQLARNAMAALLGKGPDRGLDIAAPSGIASVSDGLPANLALDLVGRRPDLVAARNYAEAAAQRIHVAKAGFYPNVNLSALVGLQTLGLDRLGGGELAFAEAGPAVSLPIFDGGNVEGGYRSARAQYDEAVALYDRSLVNALREAADAISARRSLEARLAATRAALVSAEEAYRMVRVRYEGGLASYLDALSVEDQLVDLRRALANLEASAFTLDIALIRALGGGYADA
jgi:NodT family efflux transporter outer membrane factor (OMF) lipoprotein